MSDMPTPDSRNGGTARSLIGQAGETIKAEAQSFASVAQDRVRAEAEKGVKSAGRTLGDFANAVRRAGDELAGADQSPAARLVGQAAEGLEGLSRNLAGKDAGELLNAVRDFGRRNPMAFIGGAVLAGLALGRFARASDHREDPRDEPRSFAADNPYESPARAIVDTYPPMTADMGDAEPLVTSTAFADDDEETTSLGMGEGTSGIGESDGGGAGTGR